MSKKPDIEDLRDLKDGVAELVDNINMCFTSAETILGYLMIGDRKTQVTLKAETIEDNWISD